MKKYPKVNYIGNKEKIAKWVVDCLPIKCGRVLDLFSGGASVSYELKKRGFEVHSNDALYSSYILSKSLIENSSTTLDKDGLRDKLKNTNIIVDFELRKSLEWLENKLFYQHEVDELARLIEYSFTLCGYEKYLMQALIRRACIRKLPYSRMNVNWTNIVKLRDEEFSYKKYGRRRAYHNQSFYDLIMNEIDRYNLAIFDNGKKNMSYHNDCLELLKKINAIDLVYADPPYPGTMNNYGAFYGNFDKIFNEEIEYVNLTKGSDFLELIQRMIEISSEYASYFVLSLSSNSNPNINEVEKLFAKYGTVTVYRRKHNYQVSGKDKKNLNEEILAILCFSHQQGISLCDG